MDADVTVAETAISPTGELATKFPRPDQTAAEEAVRTLIRLAGDDPERAGLADTPQRVVRAFGEWFSGYKQNPVALLQRTFDEVAGYHGSVELRDIPFHSFCEHHLAGIRGKAHIAYVPKKRVVGISKLARVVEACSRRLQIQERLTAEIATAIDAALSPSGVAVVLEAEHACMTTRGVHSHGSKLVTKHLLGDFISDTELRRDFLLSLG